jgi:hypothetical protein
MSAIIIAISNAISCRQIAKDPQTNASLSKKIRYISTTAIS